MSDYEQLTKEDFKAVLENPFSEPVFDVESFNELKFQYFENGVFYYKVTCQADAFSSDPMYTMVFGIDFYDNNKPRIKVVRL